MPLNEFTPNIGDKIINPQTGEFTEIGRILVRNLSAAGRRAGAGRCAVLDIDAGRRADQRAQHRRAGERLRKDHDGRRHRNAVDRALGAAGRCHHAERGHLHADAL
jgi:hypothetical protein